VPMEFNGQQLADGFCLKTFESGCNQPYGSVLISRASLSGVAAEDYCGISESLTTCTAILDFGTDCSDAGDSACGVSGLDDGRCELLGAFESCTYSCSRDSQCESGEACGGSLTGDDYCGGGA
jgi:hypothetical protein